MAISPRRAWIGVSVVCVAAALAIYLSAGLFVRTNPLIHVRWRNALSESERAAGEKQLRLQAGEQLAPATWRYELADTSRDSVGAIVRHPDIDDTHYVDRSSLTVQPDAPRGPRRPASLAGYRPELALAIVDYAPAILLAFAAAVMALVVGVHRSVMRPVRGLGRPIRLIGTAISKAWRLAWPPSRILPLALAASAPVWLIASFVIGSIPDGEELRWGVLSSFLHVRALAEGSWPSWTSTLGLGMPERMVPNFHLHPLLPLLAVMSPASWVRLLYVAHTLVGALGAWQLGRTLQLTPLTTAVCVFTFLLATPTQNYALTDFWLSHYVMWTSAPWLLLLAWRLLESGRRDTVRLSILLGLCAGVVVASTHPGHVPVYGTVALAVAAGRWRQVAAHWPALLLAAILALVIASPNVLQLMEERTFFAGDPGIEKLYPAPLPSTAWWDVFLRPFPRAGRAWTDLVDRDARVPFFGGPFALLAVFGLLAFARNRPDLTLGAALSAVLLFSPLLPSTLVSRYHFRDPALLCAIPLAGLAADALLRSSRTRRLAAVLLAAQVCLVALATYPFIAPLWAPESRDATWLRSATGDTPLVDRLLASLPEPGRVAFAPQIDGELMNLNDYPEIARAGLGQNALAYRGTAVVNGSFKGVSTDVLWSPPEQRLFYGRISVPSTQFESKDGLDLLGIKYVFAVSGEPVAPGLRLMTEFSSAPRGSFSLYENPDASPGAFLLDDAARLRPALRARPGCFTNGLLCKDFTALTDTRRADRIQVARRSDRIDVTVDRADVPRLLVVAEMFRPGWIARTEDRPLPTSSIGPGLIGVRLPPGTAVIRLDYHPPTLLTSATVLSWCVLAVSLAALLALPRRPAQRHSPGAPD